MIRALWIGPFTKWEFQTFWLRASVWPINIGWKSMTLYKEYGTKGGLLETTLGIFNIKQNMGTWQFETKKNYLSHMTLGNLYNMHHPMQTTNTIVHSTFHFWLGTTLICCWRGRGTKVLFWRSRTLYIIHGNVERWSSKVYDSSTKYHVIWSITS